MKVKTAPPASSLAVTLDRLEGVGAALAEQQDIAGRAAREQRTKLRAEYEATVRPLLPTLAALEREHRIRDHQGQRIAFRAFRPGGCRSQLRVGCRAHPWRVAAGL